ncbi:MAG: HAMP domain-containing protein [Candidatus Deferrimicrobiaceae bacterium]
MNGGEQRGESAKRSWFGLLEAFLLFIGFLFLADTALQYFISSSQASKAREEVLSQTAIVIGQKIDQMRASTEFLLLQSKNFSGRNIVDLSDFRSANPFFMDYLKANPHITSVNFGDSNGNGYLLLFADGRWKNRIKRGSERGSVLWQVLDERGDPLATERRGDDYDPRARPWYTEAAGAPGIRWSSPYVFRTTGDVGITASMAVGAGERPPVEIIGVDVMLKDLSRFLSTLKQGRKDLSVSLVSKEGEILATSETEAFGKSLRENSGKLPTAGDAGLPDLAAAYRALDSGNSDFRSVSSSGKSYYALRRPFRFSGDREYFVIMTIPKESLLSFFDSWNRIRLVLFLFLVAVSSLFFASRYIAPLRKLTRTLRTFATGVYDLPALNGRKDEIGLLISEFRRMAEDLKARREELEGAAKALGHAAGEWQNTFDSMTDLVSVHDAEYRIVKANRAMSSFLGAEPGDLAGKKCHAAYTGLSATFGLGAGSAGTSNHARPWRHPSAASQSAS